MNINDILYFDRKNYYYFDLPKGYQITQNKNPIAKDGIINLSNKIINIERIHLEEDAAKSIHKINLLNVF
jgi:aspartyl-tRNA(Asn)/glutamyl-tRNA(Gln) amidotransferase subunit B